MSENQTLSSHSEEYIKSLVQLKSKHSAYQALHPKLNPFISEAEYIPSGKSEAERFSYMKNLSNFSGKNVLDIGANTGYFSFDALENGAAHVTAYEGNKNHADFILAAANILSLQDRIRVHSDYYSFTGNHPDSYQIGICLNVLHHLGDDFEDAQLSIIDAKQKMGQALQSLSLSCDSLWFQLGFNWKGNPALPLFQLGSKKEIIDFVKESCLHYWDIQDIGIYNPESKEYEAMTPSLMGRFDHLGEFLNRPIFLLRKSNP